MKQPVYKKHCKTQCTLCLCGEKTVLREDIFFKIEIRSFREIAYNTNNI